MLSPEPPSIEPSTGSSTRPKKEDVNLHGNIKRLLIKDLVFKTYNGYRFKDSLQHLPSSLGKLVVELNNPHQNHQFPLFHQSKIIKDYFSKDITEENINVNIISIISFNTLNFYLEFHYKQIHVIAPDHLFDLYILYPLHLQHQKDSICLHDANDNHLYKLCHSHMLAYTFLYLLQNIVLILDDSSSMCLQCVYNVYLCIYNHEKI